MPNRPASILFLSQVLPYPLDAGPKVRAYYTLRYLAQHSRVTLLSFVRPTDTPAAIQHLKTFCEAVVPVPLRRTLWRDGVALLQSLFQNRPFFIVRDQVHAMTATIGRIVAENEFAAIHADQLSMAAYALTGQNGRRKTRTIIDLHNAYYLIPERMAAATPNRLVRWWLKREARGIAQYEGWVCQQFDKVVTVTENDRQALSGLRESTDLAVDFRVLPICIDLDEDRPLSAQTNKPVLLFVGGMHWPPNADGLVWFVKEVLPLVRGQVPDVHLVAIGRQPPRELQAAARTGAVTIPGHVSNIDGFWRGSQIFIVPLRSGGGMRVKILEAWANSLPVVSTTLGVEGMVCQPGQDIFIADSASDFADAVCRLLIDRRLAEAVARAGRATVEKHYNWRSVYPAWDEIYS